VVVFHAQLAGLVVTLQIVAQVFEPVAARWTTSELRPEPGSVAVAFNRPRADVCAGVIEGHRRAGVVDAAAGDHGRGRRVAGRVGGDDAQIVDAVGDRDGRPCAGVGGARRGAGRAPGRSAGGRGLEAQRGDPRARVGGAAGQGDAPRSGDPGSVRVTEVGATPSAVAAVLSGLSKLSRRLAPAPVPVARTT
jgi:hypothetical protein